MTKLTDDSIMPFGEYKGKKMRNVPAWYLDKIQDHSVMTSYPEVLEYIQCNQHSLDKEIEDGDW